MSSHESPTQPAQTPPVPVPRPPRFTFATGDRPLDGYTIKRGIGFGGFGQVYFAVSDGGKEVALKQIERHLEVELRGVAQCLNLKHPGLVSLYDVRQDAEGRYWVVMEFVAGETLGEIVARHPQGLPAGQAVEHFRGIAAAVGHLHAQGIVHRDLKPGNIFVENGTVKVGDYGLAKYISAGTRNSQTESVGTVHYMAPEISRGRYGKSIDLYALGVILYELLSGRVPFDGESPAEVLMKHLTAQPDPSALPPAFRPVVTRLLAKEESDRYASVADALADVERSLSARPGDPATFPHRGAAAAAGMPPVPRHAQPAGDPNPYQSPLHVGAPPSPSAEFPKGLDIGWCFNQALAVYGANVVVLVVAALLHELLSISTLFVLCGPLSGGFALLCLNGLRRGDRRVELADLFRPFNQFFGLVGLFLLTFVLELLGLVLCVVPGLLLGTIWLFPFTLMVDKKLSVFDALRVSSRIVTRNGLWPHFGLYLLVLAIAIVPALIPYLGIVIGWFVTPIASLLVAAAYVSQVETAEAEIAALNAARGVPRQPSALAAWARRVRPAAVRLAVAMLLGLLAGVAAVLLSNQVFDFREEQLQALTGSGAGCLVGGLALWQLSRRLATPHRFLTALAALFIVGGLGLSVSAAVRWQSTVASTGLPSAVAPPYVVEWEVQRIAHTTPVSSLAYNPAGDLLVSTSDGWPVRTWDLSSGAQHQQFQIGSYAGVSAVFSPDGQRIAVGSALPRASIWDVASAQRLFETADHSGSAHVVAYSPNGELLATCGDDDVVRLLSATDGQQVRQLFGCPAHIRFLEFRPEGGEVAAASIHDGAVHVWEVATGRHVKTLSPTDTTSIRGLCHNRDGSRLAVAEQSTIHVWDDARERWIAELEVGDEVNSIDFAPDGRLAVASLTRIDLWDIDLAIPLCRFTAHSNTVTSVAVHPDGTRLASGSRDATIRIWEVPPAFRATPAR